MKVFDENIPGLEALRDPEAQMIRNTDPKRDSKHLRHVTTAKRSF